MLVHACQLVKERGLSAILVTHKGESQYLVLIHRLLFTAIMFAPHFAIARMHILTLQEIFISIGRRFSTSDLAARLHIDFRGIVQTQSQLVSLHQKLHRVAHRSILDHGHLSAGNHSHVQKMLSQGSFTTHLQNCCRLSYAEFLKCHCHSPFSFFIRKVTANLLQSSRFVLQKSKFALPYLKYFSTFVSFPAVIRSLAVRIRCVRRPICCVRNNAISLRLAL